MCKFDAPVSALSPDDYRKLSARRLDSAIHLLGPETDSNDPFVCLLDP